MRHEISKEEYERAHSGNLSEMFEVMVQQRFYLEVDCVTGRGDTEIVGALTDDEQYACGFYNASFLFDRVSKVSDHGKRYTVVNDEYPIEAAVKAGDAKRSYWLYDTVEDARAHAAELLQTATVSL